MYNNEIMLRVSLLNMCVASFPSQLYLTIYYVLPSGLLNDAIETHFRSFRTLSLGVQYLIALNPDFLLLVVKDCLHYAPTQVRDKVGEGERPQLPEP